MENSKIIIRIINSLLGTNFINDKKGNWKETFNMFKSLIDKPYMTEKLVKRPPPKYIYDIIMNTMKKLVFQKVFLP